MEPSVILSIICLVALFVIGWIILTVSFNSRLDAMKESKERCDKYRAQELDRVRDNVHRLDVRFLTLLNHLNIQIKRPSTEHVVTKIKKKGKK
jgi:hypothetical protein